MPRPINEEVIIDDTEEESVDETQEVSPETEDQTEAGEEGGEEEGSEEGSTEDAAGGEDDGELAPVIIKVNGKEVDISKYSDEDKLKLIQKGMAAQERFDEAAKQRQEAAQFVELAKTDPVKFLQANGVDTEKMAMDLVYRKVQLEKMSPEEKQAYELTQKNAELKQENQTLEQKRAEAKKQQEMQARYDEFLKKSTAVIDQHPTLEADNEVITRFADIVDKMDEDGLVPDYEKIAEKVNNDLNGLVVNRIEKMDDATLYKILGRKNIDRVRKMDLAKIKEPKGKGAKPSGKTAPVPRNEKKVPWQKHKEYMQNISNGMDPALAEAKLYE